MKEQVRKEMGLMSEAETSVRTNVESLKSKQGDVKAFSEELKKMLGEATLANVQELDASTQMSIAQLTIGVAREMDKTTALISKLDAYNEEENQIIQDAKDAVTQAEAVLERAKIALTKKNWFNSIFTNHEANVKKAEEAVETAKKLIPLAEKRALEKREARQASATTEQNVASMVSYAEAAVEVLEELYGANIDKMEILEDERKTLQKKYESSEKELKTLRSSTEAKERAIQKAQAELDGLPAEEVAEKNGEISVMQIELEKLRSRERQQLSDYMSAEKLTKEHLIQIKSTQLTNAVIRSLQNTIKTETESRVKSFDVALQQLKNGQALRVASVVNDSSNAMAIQFSKISLNVMASAHKEFRKNLQEHATIVAKEDAIADEMKAVANELVNDVNDFQKTRELMKKNRPRKGDFKKEPDPNDNGNGGNQN
jgi:hypothetical protein